MPVTSLRNGVPPQRAHRDMTAQVPEPTPEIPQPIPPQPEEPEPPEPPPEPEHPEQPARSRRREHDRR